MRVKLRAWAMRARGWWRGPDASEFESEMEAHRELLEDEYRRRGWTPDEAAQAARRDMGNRALLREQYREQRGLPFLEQASNDVRYGFRSLRRAPTFTAASVAVLGVGLGGTLTVACVLSTLVLRPLPYPDAKSLVFLNEVDPRGSTWPFSEPMLQQTEARTHSLSAVGG